MSELLLVLIAGIPLPPEVTHPFVIVLHALLGGIVLRTCGRASFVHGPQVLIGLVDLFLLVGDLVPEFDHLYPLRVL